MISMKGKIPLPLVSIGIVSIKVKFIMMLLNKVTKRDGIEFLF